MEKHSVCRAGTAGLRCLLGALAMALLTVFILLSPAAAADCDYQIDLEVVEQAQPNLNDQLFGGLPEERYFLLLGDKVLVAAEDDETLTQLVMDVAGRYVNDSTISCRLDEEEQLQLCYGPVSIWTSTDMDAAAETLLNTLTFVTVEETVSNETVHYRQVTVQDPDRYVDEEPVVSGGVNGLREVTTHTTCENGLVKEREEVSSRTLIVPVAEVTSVGIKEHPLYIWPAEGRVSSHFGPRNISGGSKNHKGVDIACPKGSEIVAARAGTVIWSGWNGGYGYLIKIEHEDGNVTYYGHNSELIAQEGDWVEQGDLIALSGSTGQSTGPHCHFEIRIDDNPVDPEDWLEPQS
ncbi:MAG: peptidoglycan DD-metalloendopeptidase family protein [Oscillospiraceae bacterium]|nr:peptidoglycan DD-metalloendopeptidase family protein [Oscillospiraceae bacterium]